MKKIKIANELLNNTSNIYIKEFVQNYILNIRELEEGKCLDESLMRFHNCVSYIETENFDITGWMLFEIPIFYAHCFRNERTNQKFDLAAWDLGEVIPRYLDENWCERDCKSINEAIANYSF